MKKLLIIFTFLAAFMPMLAYASPTSDACSGAVGNAGCAAPSGADLGTGLKSVANILIFVVGAVSVLMIIIGGLRYVLSGGDSAGVKSAKDTILYAIIGLVVALVAYGIVNFVLRSLHVIS